MIGKAKIPAFVEFLGRKWRLIDPNMSFCEFFSKFTKWATKYGDMSNWDDEQLKSYLNEFEAECTAEQETENESV